MAQNLFKVKLRSQVSNTTVAFDVTPEITETRNVNYKTLEPVHMPGGIHIYGSTASRNYQINNIRLVSRTGEEAARNLYRLNVMRGWAMPYFGRASTKLIGAPPDVLALSAYARGPVDSTRSLEATATEGNSTGNRQQLTELNKRTRATNIQNVPVVLTQISIPYPSDVDYIPTARFESPNGITVEAGVPFPTIMTVDMTLMETHSPTEYARFDLAKFRAGVLDNF